MRFNRLEKTVAAIVLVTTSSAALSSLLTNPSALALQVQGLVVTQEEFVSTHVRGLANPMQGGSQYLHRDRDGKVIKVDASTRLIEKGTMIGARSDSYQSAHYLNRDAAGAAPLNR